MTMKELAKLAGVSIPTVSKAFSGAKDINEKTRAQIFDLARQTGCYNKYYKGKYPQKIVAVICHEIISNYYVEFIDCLRQKIEDAGNIVLIATDDFSKKKQADLIDYFSSYLKVDGIIVFNLGVRLKKNHDTPLVALFSGVDERVDTVFVDTRTTIKDAAALLWDYGHRNIAFIGENLTKSKNEMFVKSMVMLSGRPGLLIQSEKRFEAAGEEGVDRLMDQAPDCTAIICAYDNIALGAIKQLQRYGKSVPADISVIGINDIGMSRYAETSLTTMGVDADDVCCLVFEILQKKLKNPYYKTMKKIQVKNELIIRQSIRKIK